MRDDQYASVVLARIIEKYPELYNPNYKNYGRRSSADQAWEKVIADVKNELNESCTVDEVKNKFKGMRSSYIRFKHKINEASVQKVYYLYDKLHYLEPYVKLKKTIRSTMDGSEMSYDGDYTYDESEETIVNEEPIDIKPDISSDKIDEIPNSSINFMDLPEHDYRAKKRKIDSVNITGEKMTILGALEGNEDLAFFISILPDIKKFTRKEMRELKIKILQSINEIEENKLAERRE